MPTAEPIEVAISVMAVAAFLASAVMLRRAFWTWRDAVNDLRSEAVRTLGWMRVRNELFRLAISGSVVYAGAVQVMTPAPAVPGPNRPILQAIWLLIAFICLAKSLLNERDTRHVIEAIERERADGWPERSTPHG